MSIAKTICLTKMSSEPHANQRYSSKPRVPRIARLGEPTSTQLRAPAGSNPPLCPTACGVAASLPFSSTSLAVNRTSATINRK